MEKTIPVKEAMAKKVLTIGSKSTIAKAAKLMSQRGVGSILVVQKGRPIGILTERDILMKIVGVNRMPSKVMVKDIMSSPVLTIGPNTDIAEATRLMAKNRIRRLPVVSGKRLVGIITASDITMIAPELSETFPANRELRQREAIEESVCEVCGEVTPFLYEVNGMWVCENCKDTMGG
jgi:CBS domain-containing protein